MPNQLLHILQRHALLQKIGNGRYAETVGREPGGETGVFQAPLDHPAQVVGPQVIFR